MNQHLRRGSLPSLKKAICFIVLCLIFYASSSLAGGNTPTPSPEFTQTVENLAGQHSNDDYGQRIINWIAYGNPDVKNVHEKSLLSTVSFTLNAIALVMMAYLSLLGGMNYVIQTANKGTPGGQVISSFWMPIRIATATILLIPLASGFSSIQYGVITIAEKGNAHGSYLMDQGIDYIVKNGAYRPPMTETNSEVVIGLVMSEMCKQHIISKEGEKSLRVNKRSSFLAGATNEVLSFSYDKYPQEGGVWGFFKKLTNYSKQGYCGVVSITAPDADNYAFKNNKEAITSTRLFKTADYEDDAAILATEKVLKYIEKTVIPAAALIASKLNADGADLSALQKKGDASKQSTYEKSQKKAEKETPTLGGEINKVIVEFDKKVHEILQESVIAINKANSSSTTWSQTNESASGEPDWVKQVKKIGWPALGTVFWQISKNQEALNYLAKRTKLNYTEPNIDGEYIDDERYLTLYERLADAVSASKAEKKELGSNTFDMSAIKTAGAESSTGYIKTLFNRAFQSAMMSVFIPDDEGDLITKLQYAGSQLSATADLIMHSGIIMQAAADTQIDVTKMLYNAITRAASNVPLAGSLTGGAAAVSGAAGTTPLLLAGNVLKRYGEFMSQLIIPLLIAGFALAVVLPAIPLFFWLMGVISWMLFFVECLLVSPMWLAAHGTAEKDGWGSEHTRQGYMLMIGLYLNPILRVAGFFAIFLVLIPLGRMTGWLSEYLTGVASSGWLSPAIMVGAAVVIAVFAYSAAVRVFSLPNELFERGLRWINGGQEVTGDSSAEQQNRTIIAQVGTKADTAAAHAKNNAMRNPPPKGDPSEK